MAVFSAAVSIGTAVATTLTGLAPAVAVSAIGGTFAAAALGFLTQAAIGLALNALAPKPSSQSKQGIGGYRINGKQANLDRQIIYGETRVGGAIVFDANSNDIINERLFRIYVHSTHPIDSYQKVFIGSRQVTSWAQINPATGGLIQFVSGPDAVPNGTPLTPAMTAVVAPDGSQSDFQAVYDVRSGGGQDGGVIFRFYDGTQTAADPYLVSMGVGWNNNHKLLGCAYVFAELYHGLGNAWPNGIPEILCTIRGKKVYDPRTSTTAWSDNPALCMRDYITSEYGLNESSDNVDDTLVSTAANVCDQTDTVNGEKRYTCNGAFTTGVTPIDLLSEMLTSMGGLLWYAQGKWRMKPAYYTSPTVEFTEDDLRSSIAVKTRHSRRDNFNIVKGTFKGPATNYEFTDYPEVRNQDFIDADKGQKSTVDLNLPFTDTADEARRIARVFLERNRQQLTVSASFGMRAFQVQVGDIIQLTVDRFGWTQKEFEVASWTFGLTDAQDLQVQMTLREISANVFDEVDDGVVYERDNTTLTDPFFVPPVGINLSNSVEIVYEHARNVIIVNVTGDYQRINYVEVQYKPTGTSDWLPVSTGQLGRYRIVDLLDGSYDVRARAVNALGVKGDWVERLNFSARGLAAPPAQVTNLSAEVNGPVIHLEWDAVGDLDLSYYRLRYSSATSGASWSSGIDYVKKVAKPATEVTVPAKAGTYMIKAVDQGGRESNDMTSIVITAGNLEGFANTLTQTEDPTFSGVKTETTVIDNNLRLQGFDLFDSLIGDIDDLEGLWDDLGFVSTEPGQAGSYEFSDVIDIGSVQRARVRVDSVQSRFDYTAGNNFDGLVGNIDNLPGNWDDLTGTPDFGDTNVDFLVSTTQDDPSGTPTWSDYTKIRSADIQARAFRFKAELKTDTAGATPSISELEAVLQYN